eukprot:366223-Chlamydomonas_euryale.AAC.19
MLTALQAGLAPCPGVSRCGWAISRPRLARCTLELPPLYPADMRTNSSCVSPVTQQGRGRVS